MTDSTIQIQAELDSINLLRRDALDRGMHGLALLYAKSTVGIVARYLRQAAAEIDKARSPGTRP